jgi:hypothetical protein
MNRTNRMLLIFVVPMAFGLTAPPGWAGQEGREHVKKANVELPAAVARTVRTNFPNAVIASTELEKEAGINLYDIEFKAGGDEIEVAEDGTVMEVATIVALKDLPKPAAEAIQTAAPGAAIRRLERSEVRAEIRKEGESGKIVKLAAPRYVYKAELTEDGRRGEVQVAPDGRVVEALKWRAAKAKGKEEKTENAEKGEAEENEQEEAKPAAPDLKILPQAVLSAFKAAYPRAVIKGTSKEKEKGVTYYEVESVDGKLNRDLLYTADGKAAEIEEAMAPADLPAAVQQTLTKEFPGAKILKAERMTKGDRKLFELRILVKDKKMEVTVTPHGEIVR